MCHNLKNKGEQIKQVGNDVFIKSYKKKNYIRDKSLKQKLEMLLELIIHVPVFLKTSPGSSLD